MANITCVNLIIKRITKIRYSVLSIFTKIIKLNSNLVIQTDLFMDFFFSVFLFSVAGPQARHDLGQAADLFPTPKRPLPDSKLPSAHALHPPKPSSHSTLSTQHLSSPFQPSYASWSFHARSAATRRGCRRRRWPVECPWRHRSSWACCWRCGTSWERIYPAGQRGGTGCWGPSRRGPGHPFISATHVSCCGRSSVVSSSNHRTSVVFDAKHLCWPVRNHSSDL